MKEIKVSKITDMVAEACGRMAVLYPQDILHKLEVCREVETGASREAMEMLVENAGIAVQEDIPICQDTGMVIAFVTIGQDVHLTDGSLKEAIDAGVRKGYTEHYLRASVVGDPLFDRINTKDNTPAVIYIDMVKGDVFHIDLLAKGFGSENMSAVKMLKPAEGREGVKQFVLDTIAKAGPNACPPMVVGVGIGGTFDYCAVLAKKALLHGVKEKNPDPSYAELEEELVNEANALRIGPMGLHGKTTVLNIAIESYPTHIAGLPCAVNICCHACRHERIEL